MTDDGTETDADAAGSIPGVVRYVLIGLGLLLLVSIVLEPLLRQLTGLIRLALLYSLFLVNIWDRWTRSEPGSTNWLHHVVYGRPGRWILELLPFRAWGMVPFVLEVLVIVVLGGAGWFLGPVFYKVMKNPSTLGLIRDAMHATAPELVDFINTLLGSPEPFAVLERNARQVFTSLNRFIALVGIPLVFILFTALGSALYDTVKRYFVQLEENGHEHSRILDAFSRLLTEYLWFTFSYYALLGGVIGGILLGLDTAGLTRLGWKIVGGIVVSFLAGNLLLPGLGTLMMTVLVVGLMYVDHGLMAAAVAGGSFSIYFLMDDYAIKPAFITWLGARPGRLWEFGFEVLLLGIVVLYAAFGLIGALLAFPSLCFLDAYLREKHPELRPWLLHPVRQLRRAGSRGSDAG